jgi:hypothetical protein
MFACEIESIRFLAIAIAIAIAIAELSLSSLPPLLRQTFPSLPFPSLPFPALSPSPLPPPPHVRRREADQKSQRESETCNGHGDIALRCRMSGTAAEKKARNA